MVIEPVGISGPDAGETEVTVGPPLGAYVNWLTWASPVELEVPRPW